MSKFILVCLMAVLWEVNGASAPFITPCRIDDFPCVVSSAQAAIPSVAPGIPELGIKPLDPMHIDVIKSEESGLKLLFKDTTVTGLKGCKVDAFKQDLSKGKQQILLRCSVLLKGDYSVGGRLVLLPIQGQGTYVIDIRDIVIKTTTDLETVQGEDGAQHWHIKNWRHSYNTKTGAKFQFNNLFNGNKILAAPVEQFLNSNWRDVMTEVAPPIVRTIVSNVVDAVRALYKNVPVDQLAVQ